jgi:hypothetical protein
MSVYRLPEWMAEPCDGYADCAEPELHTHHMKWWARILFRLGIFTPEQFT